MDDKRWTYDGLLPYFRKIENHHDPQSAWFQWSDTLDLSLGRTYPLTKRQKEEYLKVGVKPVADYNGGNDKGMASHIENWHNGKRQPAGKAYGLQGVEVLTNTTVRKIILQDNPRGFKEAAGVELTSGHILKATREVIVCCGALRTPQLLMLSGIGPADELKKHHISLVVEAPDLGENFFDHAP